ncbi:hypothetical protein ACFSR7_07005 [Cohnella sp. GCM10020058]|uniref:hypothetical protein n=1 Tax=Cohnella sp. GCM10020058 TaxID=3317330 RepID=UPI00363B63B0
MKSRLKFISAIVLIVVIVFFLWLLTHQDNKSDETSVNHKVSHMRSFHLSSDSTQLKTIASGTVFVKGNEGLIKDVQIIARIEIDPADWGGVAFYIPDKWHVSSILNSYPENKVQSKPADNVSTWATQKKDSKWNTMIEIGRNRNYKATGGGTGTVVINIQPDNKAASKTDVFTIGVEVGSKEEDGGIKIMGTDSLEVPISMSRDE